MKRMRVTTIFPLHDALRTLNLVGCITVPRRLKNYRIIKIIAFHNEVLNLKGYFRVSDSNQSNRSVWGCRCDFYQEICQSSPRKSRYLEPSENGRLGSTKAARTMRYRRRYTLRFEAIWRIERVVTRPDRTRNPISNLSYIIWGSTPACVSMPCGINNGLAIDDHQKAE